MDIFLKSGIFGLLIVACFILLLFGGIIVMAISRSRRAAGAFALLAFVPLLLGLCGTYFGNLHVDHFVAELGHTMPREVLDHPQGIVAEGRREARVPAYLGTGATAVLLVAAGCGFALAGKSKPA